MEQLSISGNSKQEKYETLLPQVQAVMDHNVDGIANMANMAAMLHETFGFWWTGFYRVINGELVLGPFQGPLACTRIAFGRGVCGTAWKEQKTMVVPDVELFPGHIACSSASRSEIVVPVFKDGEITAVLDIDSAELNTFNESFSIHHSAFIIQHSSFSIHHSAFIIQHSSFSIKKSIATIAAMASTTGNTRGATQRSLRSEPFITTGFPSKSIVSRSYRTEGIGLNATRK